MNKGFLTLAQNGTHDYVKMAYVLAMSLKLSQGIDTKLSIIVNEGEVIPANYKDMFDQIIYTSVPDDEWKVQNKWRYYELTPYDETIVLDADMIFLNDHNWWWDFCKLNDILFTTSVYNYKGEEVTSDYYRKVFTENNMPSIYTGLFYFKKSKVIEDYFKLVRIIFENWKEYYNQILKNPPNYVSGDVVYAMATKIMFQMKFEHLSPFFHFVHMRNQLQNAGLSGDWTKTLRVDLSNYKNLISLKINNIRQEWPLHYIKKSFLTDEVVMFYEENTICLLQ
jgi:hypothetical protein